MLTVLGAVRGIRLVPFHPSLTFNRFSSTSKPPTKTIRNISIIAHIDAGKTTLTEQLLHLTNALGTSSPGDVDSGSTVTDFLDAERQRGITIQSAAVGPIYWNSKAITLVDTPGHIDFSIEVERALRVVDGAVVILDGVEGVEAQTEMVCRQAERYNVKSILLFVNKLDRQGSSLAKCVKSVRATGVHRRPVVMQLPLEGLRGVVDLVKMQVMRFEGKAGELVKTSEELGELKGEAEKARSALVETVASHDDTLLDELLEVSEHSLVSPTSLQAAIRRQVHNGTILPFFCGSAAKNVGVQPLLDAISNYLPSPLDIPTSISTKKTTALAFKVVHDKRRGPITFIRVYSGTLSRSSMYNTTTGTKERLSKLLLPFADQYVETDSLTAGQIGVVLGLKDTRTGDTLIDANAHELRTMRLKKVHIPPPVFSMSVEPISKSDEAGVVDALQMLIRTDPSLRLSEGGTGQTVLSGMGELHLEIARDRLENEFGVRARMGGVRVSYRETMAEGMGVVSGEEMVERELAGKKIKAGCTITVRALEQEEVGDAALGGNLIDINLAGATQGDAESYLSDAKAKNEEDPFDITTLTQTFKTATLAALSRGPLTSNPLTNLHISISNPIIFPELSTPSGISYLLTTSLRRLLRLHTVLMEPVMSVRLTLPSSDIGKVVSDLTSEQDGLVLDVEQSEVTPEEEGEEMYVPPETDVQAGEMADARMEATVHARVPLARLVRYSTRLRALTGGSGHFTMQLYGFTRVAAGRQKEILTELGR